jgi:hypothetical protein
MKIQKNYSSLNEFQRKIIDALRVKLADTDLDTWLSLPNKQFRNSAPIDMLQQGEYEYFYSVLGVNNILN